MPTRRPASCCPATADVTIVADGTLEGQEIGLHADQAHGTISKRALRFTLLRGRQDERAYFGFSGNLDGHRDLTFSVGEVAVPPPSDDDGGEEPPPEPLAIAAGADSERAELEEPHACLPGQRRTRVRGRRARGVGHRDERAMGRGVLADYCVTLSDFTDVLDAQFTTTVIGREGSISVGIEMGGGPRMGRRPRAPLARERWRGQRHLGIDRLTARSWRR